MARDPNQKDELAQDLQAAGKPGLFAETIQRRDFAKLLGGTTALLSGMPLMALADAGGVNKHTAPVATPIVDATAQPATIGSYQRKNGYFTWSVTANGGSREIEVYIPQGARQREFWIGITVPDGVQSNQFLNDAGWFGIADQSLACLLIMKPGASSVWGDPATELAYVTEAMLTLVSSGPHYSAFTYHYVVGYGAGAAPLQLYSASNPLRMISQVYVAATTDMSFNALLAAAGNTQVTRTPQPNDMDFTGYTDINNNPVTDQRTFAAQFYRDIPIPTWFVGDTPTPLLSYWADVNDCSVVPVKDGDFGRVYWQDKSVSNAIATSDSDVRTQLAVLPGKVKMDKPKLTASIYRFLAQYSGYDNNSVYGHFITKRLDYAKAIAAGNLIYKDHMWSGSTTLKTYMVYVPDSVKKKYSLSNPAPVVFCTHGAGQTAFVFFEATDVKEAADKYGFIAVTYDDTSVAYMKDLVGLVKEDCKSLGVAADDRRLYVYGQSAGGGAVTNFARDETLVSTFAAFGHTSGTYGNPSEGASTALVPLYMIYGEYDYWPMKFGPLGPGDWRGSLGGQGTTTVNAQNYWLGRLVGTTVNAELASPTYALADGISASLIPQNTPISLILKPTPTANRYKTYTWTRHGVPLFVFGQCYGRGHNLISGDIRKMWEESFSKWQRSSQANALLYWSDGVGVGQAVALVQS
jgi:poly(3-hydroxybutyrate) depolymerase